MKSNMPLPEERKLAVLYRVEPGCLGPDGEDYIKDFCHFAQKEYEVIDSDFIHWTMTPRHDKSLPEMQYGIGEKKLTRDKASKYLQVFDKNIDEFEDFLNEKLVDLIDQFREK